MSSDNESYLEDQFFDDNQYFQILKYKLDKNDFQTYFENISNEFNKKYNSIIRFEYARSPSPSTIRQEKENQLILQKNMKKKSIISIFLFKKTLTYISQSRFWTYQLRVFWYNDLNLLKKEIITGFEAFKKYVLSLPSNEDTLLIKEGSDYDKAWQQRNKLTEGFNEVVKQTQQIFTDFLTESKERYQQRLDQKKVKNNQ